MGGLLFLNEWMNEVGRSAIILKKEKWRNSVILEAEKKWNNMKLGKNNKSKK